MSLTKHQKEVIRLIKEDGFVLKCQKNFGQSWWLDKDILGGYINSKNILKSTAKNLIDKKIIELNFVDNYKHYHYKLTELVNQIIHQK